MDKEEQYMDDYQRTRRILEEQEDAVKSFQRKGQQLAENTLSEIHHTVQLFAETNEPFEHARNEIAQLEEAFLTALNQEKKKILLQEEEAERMYRKNI
ncbi:hypothetical protein [Enterococcus caccae]|uniref:Uncharacterized protein n=1 Tax=Enterococcus caccae ATCC BAA-1240 TaxID=1158612 RepID=R3WR98_9ENTE|nr:hypothetical protein [Enterococcus caccae]EOL50371.1 hypothetical protein UC7_00364 [Enterococcus caccae ATCC BAA-1240]EOT59192.1 hypothetical protein I580_02224 [Enterococcus caccae ATCC BAA-1240]OJG25724.1 hypothetical protein RU98_GL000965 [Enterococcus caccae]